MILDYDLEEDSFFEELSDFGEPSDLEGLSDFEELSDLEELSALEELSGFGAAAPAAGSFFFPVSDFLFSADFILSE